MQLFQTALTSANTPDALSALLFPSLLLCFTQHPGPHCEPWHNTSLWTWATPMTFYLETSPFLPPFFPPSLAF